ncbi:DUF7010 family protein [Roseimarinus sediminis]|jgi:hypothetical protein|uniref:DUF7010 family protein n=1 Tax=Roseimarinus sediminis TaxID=1610899 RepID=UPI003D219947
MEQFTKTLEQQREEFAKRKFMATPIAGIIAWLISGIAGTLFPPVVSVWVLFIATGSIVYMALFISKFTGEKFLDKSKAKNEFDRLFLFTVFQAVLVYSIAIPFFLIDYSSLPMTIGILTGLMWVPFSWMIKHWVGIFHSVVRTVIVLILWYALPQQRFVAIPLAIVFVYILTIAILMTRNQKNSSH